MDSFEGSDEKGLFVLLVYFTILIDRFKLEVAFVCYGKLIKPLLVKFEFNLALAFVCNKTFIKPLLAKDKFNVKVALLY